MGKFFPMLGNKQAKLVTKKNTFCKILGNEIQKAIPNITPRKEFYVPVFSQ